jgi:hypothetical protein
MSGIAPSRRKAAFDPLMNPGEFQAVSVEDVDVVTAAAALPKSSLALSKEAPVSAVLAALALSNGEVVDDDEPVAQSMSEFLGETAGGGGGSLFHEKAKQKASKIFDDSSDEEDEATKARKAKRREQLAKEAADAKAKAAASTAQVVASTEDEVIVPSSRPAHMVASGKRAAPVTKDLFADEEDAEAAEERKLGLKGVYVPSGAAEYHTAETKFKAEQVDKDLLAEPNDDDLDELGGLVSTGGKTTSGGYSAVPSVSSSVAAAGVSASDDLDDDLFSFGASSAAKSPAISADSPDFNFASYIQQQSAGTTTEKKGASLFDDE